jgi:multidrug resistance efflux pump
MIDDELDEASYGKILAAAEEIQAMARNSPAQAAAMFEQARHLLELAEQIRNDWLRRAGAAPEGVVVKPERDRLGDAKPVRDGGVWVTQTAD